MEEQLPLLLAQVDNIMRKALDEVRVILLNHPDREINFHRMAILTSHPFDTTVKEVRDDNRYLMVEIKSGDTQDLQNKE